MKLYAPEYYKSFKCIADKCTHSCCIGWEIDIDSDTYNKYSELTCEFGKKILDTVEPYPVPCFRLDGNERCPHLNEQGLCRIIINLGKDYLCKICREHPRFYLDTEVGFGMACEEACRIILSSDGYDSFKETDIECDCYSVGNSEVLKARQHLFSILKSDCGYEEKLHSIYAVYGCDPRTLSRCATDSLFDSFEYLDGEHKELFKLYSPDTKTPAWLEKSLERGLAYFIFRHCTQAEDLDEMRPCLGFALFCERLMCAAAAKLESPVLAARIISEELEYSEDNTEKIKELFL